MHADGAPFARQTRLHGIGLISRLDPAEVLDDGAEHPAGRTGDPAADGIPRAPVGRPEILVGKGIGLASRDDGRMRRVVGHHFSPAAQCVVRPARDDVRDDLEGGAMAIRRAVFIHARQEHGHAADVFIGRGVRGPESKGAVIGLEHLVHGPQAEFPPLALGDAGKDSPGLGIEINAAFFIGG